MIAYRGVCPNCGHTLLARPKRGPWMAMWHHLDEMFRSLGRLFT